MNTLTLAYNLNTVSFTQDTDRPYLINITATNEYYITSTIGRFDFYNKHGYLTLLDGSKKDFKQFKSLLNTFFKYDDMFGWSDKDIKAAQEAGKQQIKQDKLNYKNELKETYTNKATDFLNKLNNKDTDTINCINKFNDKTDVELLEIIDNTFKKHISKELRNTILNAIKSILSGENVEVKEADNIQPSTTNQESTEETKQTNNTEVFHLYKNTFTTYSEAYNYALTHRIPVTMIISSLHPTMSNDRLQQLEKEYVFSKGNMSYNDMIEYLYYLEPLSLTTDKEERYYKLKSYIQRYEYNQQQRQNREQEKQRLSLEGSRLLVFMKEKGLQLETREGWQRYLYKGEHVYSFHSCSVEKYYNDMVNLFNTYFSQYTDEYNNSSVYYYKGNENTVLDNDNYPKGWISYNNTTYIAIFNRQLTNEEMIQYNLTEDDNIKISA